MQLHNAVGCSIGVDIAPPSAGFTFIKRLILKLAFAVGTVAVLGSLMPMCSPRTRSTAAIVHHVTLPEMLRSYDNKVACVWMRM